MSILIPIDGAIQQTSETLAPALIGFGINSESRSRGMQGFDIQGRPLSIAREGFTSGMPSRFSARSGFDIGRSMSLDLTLQPGAGRIGFGINAFRTRQAIMGLTVSRATLSGSTAARVGFNVGRSVLFPALSGFDVRGGSFVPARQGFGVRNRKNYQAIMGLNIQGGFTYPVRAGFDLGNQTRAASRLGFNIRGGQTFLILADLYPASYPSNEVGVGGYYPTQYLKPFLTVDGAYVPVVDFQLDKPKNRLGMTFNARVARFNLTGLAPLSTVNFGFLIYNPQSGEEVYHSMMTGGKLMGREKDIGWREQGQNRGPNDVVQVSAIDVVGDRFNLRPKLHNVVMYDPLRVKAEEVKTDTESALRSEAGFVLNNIIEPRVGLTMYDGLNRAYGYQNGLFFMSPGYITGQGQLLGIADNGVGLGFSGVFTNIPNYPVSRVDFSVEGGWHEGALPLYSMYGPVFFDILNRLFIVNTTKRLPFGFIPKLLPVKGYQRLSLVTPVKEYTNAVVLTYKADAAEIALEEGIYYETLPTFEKPVEQGKYGKPGYTRTETTRWVRYTRHQDAPGESFGEVDVTIEISTFAQFITSLLLVPGVPARPGFEGKPPVVGYGGVGALTHVGRDTTTNTYNGDLKEGHTKKVEGIIASGPDASLELATILYEECEIVWEATDDPDIMVQTRCVTRIEGLIATLEDTKRVKGTDGQMHEVRIRHSAIAAQESGLIEDTTDMGFGPIRVITETLRHTKGSQMDVEISDFNVLTGTTKFSYTQPRTGNRGTSRYRAKMRHLLIRDIPSENLIGPRKPVGVNAGELPRNRAIELAHDVLWLIQNPTFEAKPTLAGVDLTLDRGSVIIPVDREGEVGSFLVEGLSIKGEPSGQHGAFLITTTLDGEGFSAD